MDEGGLDEEIEVLEAIYIDELNISRNEDSDVTQIMLQLHPATGDDLDQRYVCMTLILNIPSKYPSELPDFIIRNPRGIAEEEIASLREDMHTLCEDKRGSPMLYELIELAKDSLTAGNIPHCPCMICLEHFHEGEKFTKTECYHYFHESCLSRYVSHILTQTPDILPSHTMPTQPQSKLVCPVCREPINVKIEELSTGPKEEDFTFIPSEELRKVQDKLSAILEHQKACGGVIDVEAEKNKYLVTNQDRIVLNLPQSKTDTDLHKTRSENNDKSPREKPKTEERKSSRTDSDKGLDKRNNTSDKRTQSGYGKRNERYRNWKGSGKGYRGFDIEDDWYERDEEFSPRSPRKKFIEKDKRPQRNEYKKYEGKKDANKVANETTDCDKTIEVTDELKSKLKIDVDAVKVDNMENQVLENKAEANENEKEDKTAETKPNISGNSRIGGASRPRQNQSRDGKYTDKSNFRNKGGFDSHRDHHESGDRKYNDERGSRNTGRFGRPNKSNSYMNNRNDYHRESEEQERFDSDRFGERSSKAKNSDYSKYRDRTDSSRKHRGGFGTPSNPKRPISGDKEDKSLNANNFAKSANNSYGNVDGTGSRRRKGGFGRPDKDEKNGKNEADVDGDKAEHKSAVTKTMKDGFRETQKDVDHQDESRVKSRYADKQNSDKEKSESYSKNSDSPRDSKQLTGSERKYGPRKYRGRNDYNKTSSYKSKEDYNDTETKRSEASSREEKLNKTSTSENIEKLPKPVEDTKSMSNRLRNGDNEAINTIDKTKPRAPPGFKLAPPPGFS